MGSFVLAGLIVNGAWTQLDVIGWAVWALPVVILALDFARPRLPGAIFQRPGHSHSAAAIAVAALLCAIHVLHVGLTAREEFGFGGDEGYHLSATRAFAIYFMKAGPFLVAAVAIWLMLRRSVPRVAAAAAIATLIASSYVLPQEPLFGRYPTGFYLLSTPLNVALDFAHVPFPFTANHIVNMLSLPAWLFALRPVILGRWPDWCVLPVALLMYFQGPSIVYTGGGLLEPWPFAFLLLAVEALVALEPDRRWIAVLLAGVATLFKDTAILFVPPIWLLAMIEWRGWQPALRRHAITIGIIAVAPFLTYYAVRRGLHIERGYQVGGDAALWTVARAQEWLRNARYQLGWGGSISVAIATAWSVVAIVADRQTRRAHAVWIVAAIAMAIFFAADVASIPFTGYGRFLAYSLLAVCGSVFVTTYRLSTFDRRLVIASSVGIAALQIAATARVLALDLQPGYERNSMEWDQSLIRFPIRSLAARVPSLTSRPISRIRVADFGVDLISLKVAYPDLARRYDLQGDTQPLMSPDCACRAQTEATLAVFEGPAHFGDTAEGHSRFSLPQAACLAQMRNSCAALALEQRADGGIVGAIGAASR